MLGRRGPAQAAFTSAELRELGRLDGVELHVDPGEVELDPVSRSWLAEQGTFTARKNVELLREFAARPRRGDARRRISLRFFRSPVEIRGSGRVEAIDVRRNEIVRGDDGTLRPRPLDAARGDDRVRARAAVRRLPGRAVARRSVRRAPLRAPQPAGAGPRAGRRDASRRVRRRLDQARTDRDPGHEQARRRADRELPRRGPAGGALPRPSRRSGSTRCSPTASRTWSRRRAGERSTATSSSADATTAPARQAHVPARPAPRRRHGHGRPVGRATAGPRTAEKGRQRPLRGPGTARREGPGAARSGHVRARTDPLRWARHPTRSRSAWHRPLEAQPLRPAPARSCPAGRGDGEAIGQKRSIRIARDATRSLTFPSRSVRTTSATTLNAASVDGAGCPYVLRSPTSIAANARPQPGEQSRQARVLAAVMRHLERLHRRQRQPARDVRLRVGGQEQVEVADRDLRDDGPLVRIALRAATPAAAPAARARARAVPPSASALTGARGDLPRRRRASARPSAAWTLLGQPLPPLSTSRGRYRASTGSAMPSWSACACVRTRASSRADAGLLEPPQDRSAGRARVDEHERAVELQQRRVSLSDVQEGHHELARARRPRPRRARPRDHDDRRAHRGDRRGGADRHAGRAPRSARQPPADARARPTRARRRAPPSRGVGRGQRRRTPEA